MWVGRWSRQTTRETGLTLSPIARPGAGETEYRRTGVGRQTTGGSLPALNSSIYKSQLIKNNILNIMWHIFNQNIQNRLLLYHLTNEVSLKNYGWILCNCIKLSRRNFRKFVYDKRKWQNFNSLLATNYQTKIYLA